jgi:hypothetical protein
MAAAGHAVDPSAFRACWERIDRANAHFNAFADMWANFVDKDIYDIVLKVNDDGTGVLWVDQAALVPPLIALQIGELLYQLRAVLDGAIYTATVLETGQDPPPDYEKLEFPVRATEADFDKASWKLGPLSDERRNIVKAVQPYNAPPITDQLSYNAILGVLNDWARIDRHRKLHVVGSWCSHEGPLEWSFPDGVSVKRVTPSEAGLLENKSVVARFQLDGWKRGMKAKIKPNLVIDVAINEPPMPCDPMDHLGLRLERMLDAVGSVVRMFEISFGIPNKQ